MNRPLAAARLLPLLALCLPLLAVADAPPVARIGSISGGAPVTVTDLGKTSPAAAGMELHDGFAIKTGSDTRLTLVFRDGNVRFVGRNAQMDWKGSVAPAGPSAENTVAVLSQILSDGAPDVFRNVVTGAAMASRPEPRRRAAAPERKADDGETAPAKPVGETSGGAPAAAPVPSPAPPPPTAEPGEAAMSEMEAAGDRLMQIRSQEEKRAETVAASQPEAAPGKPGTQDAGAAPTSSDKEREAAAAGAAQGEELAPVVSERAASGASADLTPPPARMARKKEPEAAAFAAGTADGWRAGKGFLPAGGSHLSLRYGKFIAPALANAVSYTLAVYAREAPQKPLLTREGKRPEFAVQVAPSLRPGRVYEWQMTAKDAKGRTLVSARLPFGAFDEATERSLAEALRVIDALPKGVDPGAKLLLRARAFARYRLPHLALREAHKAAKSKDEAIRAEAEALLSTLGGR